jgi:hypothetical protein
MRGAAPVKVRQTYQSGTAGSKAVAPCALVETIVVALGSQKESSSFLKKRTKKLFSIGFVALDAGHTPGAQR